MMLSFLAVVASAIANTSFAEVYYPVSFDVACDFSSIGCGAEARLYKTGSAGDQAVQPAWGGNHLTIFCKGEEVYSGDAAVVRDSSQGGVSWKIQSADENTLIDLGERSFDKNSNLNPKQVSAILEFSHGGSVSGVCQISRPQ